MHKQGVLTDAEPYGAATEPVLRRWQGHGTRRGHERTPQPLVEAQRRLARGVKAKNPPSVVKSNGSQTAGASGARQVCCRLFQRGHRPIVFQAKRAASMSRAARELRGVIDDVIQLGHRRLSTASRLPTSHPSQDAPKSAKGPCEAAHSKSQIESTT